MPLDLLIEAVTDCSEATREAARRLSTTVPLDMSTGVKNERSWMYFRGKHSLLSGYDFAKYSAGNPWGRHVPLLLHD
jgi:hypothetical protein